MIKRNGQGRKELTRSSLKRMSDTEYAAYSEAFVAIRGDYQALCMIGDKLRELERRHRISANWNPKCCLVSMNYPIRLGIAVHGKCACR